MGRSGWIFTGNTDRQLPNHSGTLVAYAVKGKGGVEDVALHMLARSTDPRMKGRWGKHDALSLAEIYGDEDVARVLKGMTKGEEGGGGFDEEDSVLTTYTYLARFETEVRGTERFVAVTSTKSDRSFV